MQAPETPRKHAVLNIYLRDLAIENYPQIKHSCGVWGLFRDDYRIQKISSSLTVNESIINFIDLINHIRENLKFKY